MISGLLAFAFSFIANLIFLRKVENQYRLIASIALTPVTLSLVLYLCLLIFPGNSLVFYRVVLLVVSGGLCLSLLRKTPPALFKIDLWILIPVLLSLPLFFFVGAKFSSFDPVNYFIVGKTFLQQASVRNYPFVFASRGTDFFSWFSHPPLLSLMYTNLLLFKMGRLCTYVVPLYYLLTNALLFHSIRKHTSVSVATLFTVLLATVPIYVRVSIDGFTAPLRMFFFLLLAISLVDLKEVDVKRAGLFCGLAMWTHSIGLLALPGAVLSLLMLNRKNKWAFITKFVSVSVIVGGLPYFVNLWKLHGLDATVFLGHYYGSNLVNLMFNWQFAERGMFTFGDKILYGYFSPFFLESAFSFAFIFGIFAYIAKFFSNSADKIRDGVSGILIVYVIVQLLPVNHNIFILSPRYPLTVLPLLLFGGSGFFRNFRKKKLLFLLVLILLSAGYSLFFTRGFKQTPAHYQKMGHYINHHLKSSDRVLVMHCPVFFANNTISSGINSMDPKLAEIYQLKSVQSLLKVFKKFGITHVLMPYRPTPFETETVLLDLFTKPGILEPIIRSNGFYLFKINDSFPSDRLDQPNFLINHWDTRSGLSLTAYSNSPGTAPIRFFETGSFLQIISQSPGNLICFSNGPLWKKDAGEITTKGAAFIKIDLKIRKIAEIPDFRLYPVIAQYNQAGTRIKVVHAEAFLVNESNDVILRYPGAYPPIGTCWIPLTSGCTKIAVGFSFFRQKGGMSIESMDIYGCR